MNQHKFTQFELHSLHSFLSAYLKFAENVETIYHFRRQAGLCESFLYDFCKSPNSTIHKRHRNRLLDALQFAFQKDGHPTLYPFGYERFYFDKTQNPIRMKWVRENLADLQMARTGPPRRLKLRREEF